MDAPNLIRSTCCYCGTGCGVLIESDGSRITGIHGDPEHPANFGRLCTKGRTLPLTVQTTTGRAFHPEMRTHRDEVRQRVDWDTALDTVAERFAQIVRQHGPDSVAFYLSGQLLTEDYYIFNKLAKGLVGTNNVDTNSRLCMSSAVTGYKLAFGADGPPTSYEDLELADLVLFAGSNAAYAHPVLFRRLEEAKEKRPGTKWIVIDPRRTDTAASADLHLAILPGTDVALFNGMLHHLLWEELLDEDYIAAHTEGFAELKRIVREYTPKLTAEICGISERDLVTAAEWFGRSKAALSLYCMGLNQSSHGTDKNLALINLHLATGQIGRPGAGPFSLTGQPNAMGGREVGGMATMLAAHRDYANPEHRAEVARLWGIDSVPDTPGKPAVEMFDAIRDGRIKAVWIACTNPAHSMPDVSLVKEALAKAEFVVVQEAFENTDTVPYADVLLPASSWGEKEGTVTNSERRISRVRAALSAPGEARDDWWIASEVARRMEAYLRPQQPSLFPFASPAEVFDEHVKLTEGRDLDIGALSYAVLEQQGPTQWPMPAGAAEGTARLYTDGQFNTPSGKARIHATPYLPVAETTNARYPFHLLTGRLRDQWHGMSRTGRVPQLFEHAPEPALVMNASDADRRGFKVGDYVRVAAKRGALSLPLELSNDLPSGSVFVAMHWNAQMLNSSGANLLTIDAVDPKSFQPELKHAAVRIEKEDLPWRCVAIREGDPAALMAAVQPLLAECRYASASLVGRERPMLVVRAADAAAPADWVERLDAALGMEHSEDTQDYCDRGRGVLKRALWATGEAGAVRLAGVRLAGETAAREWLLALMSEGGTWTWPRHAVFAPRATPPSGGPAPDRTVCNCNNVKESRIVAEIARGADIEALKSGLGCGTSCGSCLPELRRLCGMGKAAA